MARLKVSIDREKCVGSGQCVLTTPEVFDQDEDDGIVVLRMSEPPEDLNDCVRNAERLCPSRAIIIHDT